MPPKCDLADARNSCDAKASESLCNKDPFRTRNSAAVEYLKKLPEECAVIEIEALAYHVISCTTLYANLRTERD